MNIFQIYCYWFRVGFVSQILGIIIAKHIQNANLNISQILTKYGYPFEVHEVKTKDSYLLDLHRIPYGRKSTDLLPNRHPALLVHGLLGSGENFILTGVGKSLAYILADRNYDVWLFNARGTWHSRKHAGLDPDNDKEYWKFSWHEIAIYDLPSSIDYVLNATGKKSLHYVGHSQGTTAYFAMVSVLPRYNVKIKVMVALAPSAFLGSVTYPMLTTAYYYFPSLKRINDILELFDEVFPFMPNEKWRKTNKLLAQRILPMYMVRWILIILSGYTNSEQLDSKLVPFIVSTVPAGCSFGQMLHYAQLFLSNKFQQFDYGKVENLKKYNSTSPPEYNLSNAKAPVAIFNSAGDVYCPIGDIERLINVLPNVVEHYMVPNKYFTHNDFIWAKDIYDLLNRKVVEVMDRFIKKN